VGKTILDDLRRGDLKRSFRRDIKDLYYFYLDEDARERLKAMGRGKRWFLRGWWLLKNLVLNLSPIRRIMLVISFWLVIQGPNSFSVGESHVNTDFRGLAFALLLIILMLELKDKLVARSELEVGRKVQIALLPDGNPVLPGWDLLLFTRPANEVGGDLVDYLELKDNRLGLTLGDVSGKGLGAALLMAKLQATLWAVATDFRSLSDLGSRLNAIFCRDGLPGRFATMIYLEIEPDSGSVRLMNAGHMPPICVKGNKLETLEPVAPPLGVIPGASYTEQQVELGRGDTLVVYSDGLTEATNANGDFFGEQRLIGLLEELRDSHPSAICTRLLSEVEGFIGEERYSDDLSLVILRRVR
jgi:serine phosphatase RsbU (regulator of sigma subunit)